MRQLCPKLHPNRTFVMLWLFICSEKKNFFCSQNSFINPKQVLTQGSSLLIILVGKQRRKIGIFINSIHIILNKIGLHQIKDERASFLQFKFWNMIDPFNKSMCFYVSFCCHLTCRTNRQIIYPLWFHYLIC